MNSERKNYPMKEFRAIFPISSVLVIRSAYAKKGQFSILAVFQNVGIYINLGCRFEFRMQKLPYERILGNFFDFIDFGHQVRVCKKKDHFSILPVILNIWDLHKFGLQIWIQNAKITLWKNFGQFFRFHRFWSSGLNSEHKNYSMKEFRTIFSISSILVIRSGYAKKVQFSILAVFQNVWDLHKFGLQIWIHNAEITLWKNFGQFFRFHRFWSSSPGMQKKVISQY